MSTISPLFDIDRVIRRMDLKKPESVPISWGPIQRSAAQDLPCGHFPATKWCNVRVDRLSDLEWLREIREALSGALKDTGATVFFPDFRRAGTSIVVFDPPPVKSRPKVVKLR